MKNQIEKPFIRQGFAQNIGDTIELADKEAQYLLQAGKVRRVVASKKTQKTGGAQRAQRVTKKDQ